MVHDLVLRLQSLSTHSVPEDGLTDSLDQIMSLLNDRQKVLDEIQSLDRSSLGLEDQRALMNGVRATLEGDRILVEALDIHRLALENASKRSTGARETARGYRGAKEKYRAGLSERA